MGDHADYGGNFYYRGKTLPKARVEKIVKLAKEQLEWAEEDRRPNEEKWNNYYRQYRGKHSPKANDIKTHSRLFVPIPYEKVEVSVPKIIGDAPEFTYLPVEESDVDPAIKINALMQVFIEQADLYDATSQMVHDGQVYGTGIVKNIWRHQVSHKVRDFGNPKEFFIDEDLLYHGPDISNIDLFRFYQDPIGTDIPSCEFIYESQRKTAMALRRLKKIDSPVQRRGKYAKLYQNIEEAIKLSERKLLTQDGDQRLTDVDQQNADKMNEKRKPLEVIEGWCLIEFSEQDGPVPGHIQLVNGIPILIHENPYKHNQPPYVRHLNLRNGNNFHGIGLIESISALVEEVNVRRNMRLDALKFSIRPEGFISSSAGLDPSLMVGYHPDRILEVEGDPSKLIHYVEFPDYTRPLAEEEKWLMENIKNTAGIPDISQGIQGQHDTKTATGIRSLQIAADLRLIRTRRYLERKSLKRIGWMWLYLARQYITKPFITRVLGDSGQAVFDTLEPKDLQPSFDLRVKVKPGEAFTDMAAREELVFLLQALTKSPNMQIYQANGGIRKLERLLLINNELVPSDMIDKIVGTDEEFKGEMEGRAGQADAAEAQVGGGGQPAAPAPQGPANGAAGGVGFNPLEMEGLNG